MPVTRMRMKQWLVDRIESRQISGLKWIDKEKKVFCIPWKHAARHGWEMDKDACLFKQWAIHTGKYKEGVGSPDPKTWKANFRCALNSLPDIKEVKDKSINKGCAAVRVYRMLQGVLNKKETKSSTKDGKKKNRRAKVVKDKVDHQDNDVPSTRLEEISMQEDTVDSTQNQSGSDLSPSSYGNEEETTADWNNSVSNSRFKIPLFQVSPIHSIDFDYLDNEAALIALTQEIEQEHSLLPQTNTSMTDIWNDLDCVADHRYFTELTTKNIWSY
ncbi:hypothetical protein ANANG_G00149420 [Anguilla anguilla]|uniref:Interferon regulatory factor n=1 Tax=Anguilla anguilla TaxID=7936 RepID=A0A9D3MCS8_ANGAN|nr:hypothetical protein ANANG_G00149420 [Anguilla anguilla]